ncbi:hypothetical protein [Pseudomonas syringae]|uniref:hypothetical protein n=1 Tax=Pseudomonas syringae TaxID=317 RepID=UPI001110A87B|nr:hypothetical protein [Pseudomonas syringae]BBN61260.1 hypothetical protein KUIN1_04500 [Pseudomonas sp. KUIN-1]
MKDEETAAVADNDRKRRSSLDSAYDNGELNAKTVVSRLSYRKTTSTLKYTPVNGFYVTNLLVMSTIGIMRALGQLPHPG